MINDFLDDDAPYDELGRAIVKLAEHILAQVEERHDLVDHRADAHSEVSRHHDTTGVTERRRYRFDRYYRDLGTQAGVRVQATVLTDQIIRVRADAWVNEDPWGDEDPWESEVRTGQPAQWYLTRRADGWYVADAASPEIVAAEEALRVLNRMATVSAQWTPISVSTS